MTQRLYEFDSYIREFDAQVLACEPCKGGYMVELSSTCFFPEGGGQPGDSGVLSGAAISDTFERDGRIWHLVERQFSPGDKVHGAIDFDRRFAHMQTHCGEHLFSAVLLRLFGAKNVGFHMGHADTTVDMDLALSAEQVSAAEREANLVIRRNLPVHISLKKSDELDLLPLRKRPFFNRELRVVEIEDCDLCCCCGTHVASTAEIGLLKVLSHENYKGGTRIHFLCGTDAFSDYCEKHSIVEQAAHVFSCKPAGLMTALEKQSAELASLKARNAAKGKLLFEYLAHDFIKQARSFGGFRLVLQNVESLTGEEMRMLAVQTAEEPGILCILYSMAEGRIALTRSAELDTVDLRTIWNKLCEKLPMRGGGSPLLIQGSFRDVSLVQIQTTICDVIK